MQASLSSSATTTPSATNMKVYLPSESLVPFVKHYLIIESDEMLVNRVFPDVSMVMAFRFKGSVAYESGRIKNDLPSTVISGLRKSGRLMHYAKGSGNVLVVFKITGAQAFINEPLHELFEESVSLDYLKGFKDVQVVEDNLSYTKNDNERIEVVEKFLLSKLSHPKPDLLVSAALQKIHSSKGNIRIKELAASLFISQDAFEKRFRRVTGLSAKQLSYIIRIKSAIHNGLTKQNLADAAFEAGYFDQSHFNKDFKLFTGQTPTEFLRSPRFW